MPPRSKQVVAPPVEAEDPPADDASHDSTEPRRLTRPRPPKKVVADVTAVLVAHDGMTWLPEAIEALGQSTHAPAHVICVDTGSTDGSGDLLAERFGSVLRLPRDTGYGAAVAAALDSLDSKTAWVWLLHDDVAVEPTTLAELLKQVELSPAAVLLGPKARDWDDPRVLVEIGLTTDTAGHRETGLERREYDQGQHDQVRDVLAVGTAGALVRRDIWDQVGGLDPELPVFRDDLDLGWKVNATGNRVLVVPDARVRHARAATTGRRSADASPGRATGTDRKHALYVLLAHSSTLQLLTLVPRLMVATALRSLGLVLTRQLAAAADEWRALLWLAGRAGALSRARKARGRLRQVPSRQLRPLFASRLVRIRARVGVLADWLGGGGAPRSNPLGALGDPGPDGEGDFEAGMEGGPGFIRRLLMRPGVQVFLGLSVITFVAERSLLLKGGALKGGALLSVPAGASDLWSSYVSAWHDVTVGTSAGSPPSTAALALLSTITLGKPSWAVDVLLLGCVPLAGLTAYLAATRLVRHLYLRLWAAATWALLPVATGTVAGGRLDAAAVMIALPLLVLWAGRVLTEDPRAEGWWRAWTLGLLLAVTAAFAPLVWPLAALVLAAGALLNLVIPGGRRRTLAALVAVLTPAAVLFPWSLQAVMHPTLFVPGPQVADESLSGWHLALLSPGGPGLPWVLVTVGLVVLGVLGTVRESFRNVALACWGTALICLLVGLLLSRSRHDGQPLWPGIAVQLASLAVLVSALVAANGARRRLASTSFGARQLLAAVVGLLAVLTPVLCAVTWMSRGADGPLRRDATPRIPAFAQAELEQDPGLRVLMLSPTHDGRLGYALTDADGARQDLAVLRPARSQQRALDAVVADLASPRGSDAAEALSTRAVRYVGLRQGRGSDEVAAVLDSQVGLVRRSSGAVALWQVAAPTNRLSLLSGSLAELAQEDGQRAPTNEILLAAPPVKVPAGQETARGKIPAGDPGRLLVLADAADDHWVATLDGKRLGSRTAWGWAQAFAVPASGGQLELHYEQGGRRTALAIQGALLLVVVILAAPGRRRGRGLERYSGDDTDRTRDERIPLAAL
jgi:GT2 family glycosyltransferase